MFVTTDDRVGIEGQLRLTGCGQLHILTLHEDKTILS